MNRISYFSIVLMFFIAACAHQPEVLTTASQPTAPLTQSPAYKDALSRAFADLEHKTSSRGPAAVGDGLAIPDLLKARSFRVQVFAKIHRLGQGRHDPRLKQAELAKASDFIFDVSERASCDGFSTGPHLQGIDGPSPCLQVEIRPVDVRNSRVHQAIHLYMDRQYRVYALNYHEVDSVSGQVLKMRKQIKWDPSEPLSSDLLSLTNEIAPIDLPLYASNGLAQARAQIDVADFAGLELVNEPAACHGSTFSYRNTFGSPIHAGWCDGDPWPTVVESNRYIAILERRKNGAKR